MTPRSGALGDAPEGGPAPDRALPESLRHELARVDREVAATLADDATADGRLARGRRTRRNVAEALVSLLAAGDPDPTAKAVAARAGVSLRLVFHHFGDMDDLYHFVAALQLRRQWSDLPRLSPRLSVRARIERTVAHRAALFEDIAPVRRALARRAPTAPALAQAIAASDRLLLENLRVTFGPDLAALPTALRAEHLGALDTAASWEVWERLRTGSGVGVRTARRVMTRLLDALWSWPHESGDPGSAPSSVPRGVPDAAPTATPGR